MRVTKGRSRARAAAAVAGGIVALSVLAACTGHSGSSGEAPTVGSASSSASQPAGQTITPGGSTSGEDATDSISAEGASSGSVQERSEGRDSVRIDRADTRSESEGKVFALDGRDRVPGAADLSKDPDQDGGASEAVEAEGAKPEGVTSVSTTRQERSPRVDPAPSGRDDAESTAVTAHETSPVAESSSPSPDSTVPVGSTDSESTGSTTTTTSPPASTPPVTTPPVTTPPKTADTVEPSWAPVTVASGATGSSAAPTAKGGGALPSGTTFALGAGAPVWVAIAANGTLSVSPAAGVVAGPVEVPVTVRYADGSEDRASVTVTVTHAPTLADASEPVYAGTVDVASGASKTATPPLDVSGVPLPAGTVFAAGEGAPVWASVDEDGSVKVSPGADIAPGAYSVPVNVTYSDRSSEMVDLAVTVHAPSAAESTDVVYAPVSVAVGQAATVAAPVDRLGGRLPAGTTFALGEGAVPWANVRPDGSIDVTPGQGATAGHVEVPVTVTYLDGSQDHAVAAVTLTSA